jgi:hypothetical protein
MNQPIKNSAVVYAKVEKIIRGCTISNPVTVDEVLSQIPEARNQQQVWDALKKYRAKGFVRRIREGMAYKYWWEEHTPVTKPEPEVVVLPPTAKEEKPELIVTPTGCTIITSRIKITIEY